MDNKSKSLWFVVFFFIFVETLLTTELTTNRTVSNHGLQDHFGFIVSDDLMNLFFKFEILALAIGLIGGLIGGLYFRNQSSSKPFWIIFGFNLLNILWIGIATVAEGP